MFKFKTAALNAVIWSALIISSCPVGAQQSETQSATADVSLKKFLLTFVDDKTTQYIAAFSDLNGDGKPEAIVYLVSNEWCGSGGCNLFILATSGRSWRKVTTVTITRPPIRVLAGTSHGWRNVSVWVGGGGIRQGYEAELQFNGKTYPQNPSVSPARKAKRNLAGEVVISSTQNAKPLYP